MKQLQIIYDEKKCVAAGLCESIDPEHFVINAEKAELIGSRKNKKGIFTLNIDPVGERQRKMIIEAAMSCPVNAISVKDLATNRFIVLSEIKQASSRELTATYNESKEWKLDPKGYFLIRIDQKNKLIEAGHCMERNIVDAKITGKNATNIFNTIIREGLISSQQHAAYLGKELYKAEIAINYNLNYVQDKELRFKK